MIDKTRTFSLPKWPITRWLANPIQEVPYEIRVALISSLYGTLPIFIGGVVNTVLVSALIALRQPQAPFVAWFAFEVILCVARTYLILTAYRAADQRRETPTDLYIILALLWAFGVGAGTFMSLLSGDWVVATLACLSSAAMMGGICFRNFGAPRLATAMIALSFGPTCLGAVWSGEPIMLLTALQIPFYLYAMGKAVYRLSAMLISTMRAERDNEHRARHDVLTGLPNRRFLMETSEALASHSTVLAIVDIDHFKTVNDTHGHQAGDAVLQTVGALMTTCLSAYGMVGRLGGEEFALIAPRASVGQIVAGLSELLRTVETTPIVTSGVKIHVTLSAGVAVREPSGSFNNAYSEADEALYRAKRSGRNRIELSDRICDSFHRGGASSVPTPATATEGRV